MKDPINEKANEWMKRGNLVPPSASEKPLETEPEERHPGARRTAKRVMSAQVQRLARRLGRDPDELAKKYPEDTVRRTKYPVIEIVTEDGKRIFKHDPGIREGDRPLIRK